MIDPLHNQVVLLDEKLLIYLIFRLINIPAMCNCGTIHVQSMQALQHPWSMEYRA